MNTNCRRRIRSTIKWGGAVLTVLLLIVWVFSGWFGVFVSTPAFSLSVVDGVVAIGWPGPGKFEWPRVIRATNPFIWWGGIGRVTLFGISVTYLTLPIWLFVFLCGVGSIILCHRDRKRDSNACSKCGYSRTGLPADRTCPECGAIIAERHNLGNERGA